MTKSKGFTIIELIVVIAIIAVLATIVLVNVTQYIAKGKNASIQGNLSTILTNSAVHYDQNSSVYTTFAASTSYSQPAAAAASSGGTVTNALAVDNSKFCVISTMNVTNTEPTGTKYCVDSSGNKVKSTTTACALGICAIP